MNSKNSSVVLFFRVLILFFCIFIQEMACARTKNPSTSLKSLYDSSINVNLVCDFKKEMIDFFDYKNNEFVKRDDLGIESLMPVLDKFIALKIINTKSKTLLYGYFLSIHDVSGKIAPDPIGTAFVDRADLFCLDIHQLF